MPPSAVRKREATRLALLVAGILAFGWAAPAAEAQTGLPSSGGSSQSGGSSKHDSGIRSVSEILESAGELLIDWLRPNEERGSVDKPRWNSLASPRHTVNTFLEAMRHVQSGRTEAWPRAAATLDLDADEPGARAKAEALIEVFDRLGKIPDSMLPGNETVENNDMRRFEVFPYAVDHEWVWNALESPPEGKIVLEKRGDAWFFSEETVAGVEDLYASMRSIPPKYEERHPGEIFLSVFIPTFMNTPWWSWVFLGASIGLAVFLAIVTARLIQRLARGAESREWTMAAQLIRGFAHPLALLVFTITLTAGLIFIEFSPTLSSFRWKTLQLLLIISLGWLGLELFDILAYALQKVLGKTSGELDQMALLIVRRGMRAAVAVLFGLFVLQNLFGMNITALLTGIGLVGLALSLAGQGFVKNLFGALSIFFNRLFVLGDWVSYKDEIGEIEDVGLQATKIRLLSGEVLTVPNMQFIDNEVENLSERLYLRRTLDLTLPYDTPPEKVERCMEIVDEVLRDDEIASEGKMDLEERPPEINFTEFGSHYLNVRTYYWYQIAEDGTTQRHSERGWYSYLHHCSMVNQRLLERLNEEDIELAFPTSTVHLTDDDRRGLTVDVTRFIDGSEDDRDDASDASGGGDEQSGDDHRRSA